MSHPASTGPTAPQSLRAAVALMPVLAVAAYLGGRDDILLVIAVLLPLCLMPLHPPVPAARPASPLADLPPPPDLPDARAGAFDRKALDAAFDAGQFVPWFQPQLCNDTGAISGVEALARWLPPGRPPVSPGEFLPALHACGLSPRLSAAMLSGALSALARWDAAGLRIARVGVNFSAEELRDPHLVDRIRWDLDRFDLGPDRLSIEVLESVIATSADDAAVRHVNALAALGCHVDLDDFGTGHASISTLQRFAVSRLKIDRSFVSRADRDPGRQRMIAAILTMADRLDLDTLAEGVETAGEHALLAQLGCGHVQGFGIARPMPMEEMIDWAARHRARVATPPRIGRRTG